MLCTFQCFKEHLLERARYVWEEFNMSQQTQLSPLVEISKGWEGETDDGSGNGHDQGNNEKVR
ncbi:hypothetical protein LINPERPRIM_LOCUS40493, partial [Linum perenne]